MTIAYASTDTQPGTNVIKRRTSVTTEGGSHRSYSDLLDGATPEEERP